MKLCLIIGHKEPDCKGECTHNHNYCLRCGEKIYFTEDEKWEDPNSLEPTDYQERNRSHTQIALLIIGFVILLLVGIIM